jgi:hypothetical protein
MAVPRTEHFDYEVQLAAAPGGGYRGVGTSRQTTRAPGLAGARPEVCAAGDEVVVCADRSDAPPRWWALVAIAPAMWIPFLGTWLMNRHVDARNRAPARVFTLHVPGLGARLHTGIRLRIFHTTDGGLELPPTDVNEVTVLDDPAAPTLTFASPRREAW